MYQDKNKMDTNDNEKNSETRDKKSHPKVVFNGSKRRDVDYSRRDARSSSSTRSRSVATKIWNFLLPDDNQPTLSWSEIHEHLKRLLCTDDLNVVSRAFMAPDFAPDRSSSTVTIDIECTKKLWRLFTDNLPSNSNAMHVFNTWVKSMSEQLLKYTEKDLLTEKCDYPLNIFAALLYASPQEQLGNPSPFFDVLVNYVKAFVLLTTEQQCTLVRHFTKHLSSDALLERVQSIQTQLTVCQLNAEYHGSGKDSKNKMESDIGILCMVHMLKLLQIVSIYKTLKSDIKVLERHHSTLDIADITMTRTSENESDWETTSESDNDDDNNEDEMDTTENDPDTARPESTTTTIEGGPSNAVSTMSREQFLNHVAHSIDDQTTENQDQDSDYEVDEDYGEMPVQFAQIIEMLTGQHVSTGTNVPKRKMLPAWYHKVCAQLTTDLPRSADCLLLPSTASQLKSKMMRQDRLPISPWLVRHTAVEPKHFKNDQFSKMFDLELWFGKFIQSAKDTRKRVRRSITRGYYLPGINLALTSTKKTKFFNDSHEVVQRNAYATVMMKIQFSNLISVNDLLSGGPNLRIEVSRNFPLRDAVNFLKTVEMLQDEDRQMLFKKPLKVSFRGEEGVDEGGISKEFYHLVTQELFNLDFGMFLFNEQTGLYWLNPQMCGECEEEYRLFGVLFGLALYNNILINVHFPMVLYRKLAGAPISWRDFEDYDPVMYNSIKDLLAHDPPSEVEDTFCLNFVATYTSVYGEAIATSLVENGDSIAVTGENRFEYVTLLADFYLNKVIAQQFAQFKTGFDNVVDSGEMQLLTELFDPSEVDELICGVIDLDMDALEQITKYQDYTANHPVIKNFWRVVRAFNEDEKKLLLKFTTGSDRTPVGGLGEMSFHIVKNGDDSNKLPTAHTCYNVLLLPAYKTEETLRNRLLTAITNCTGFGLQ